MKALVAAIHAGFLLLLGATIYIASVSDEGLVEDACYERSVRYLATSELEEDLGLTIRLPGRLEAGKNRVAAVVATASGPLRGAAAAVYAMRLRGPGEDRSSPLLEQEPGTYAGDLVLPGAGQWLLRLTVDRGGLRTERRWLATAAEPGTGRSGEGPRRPSPGGDIHSGPVTAFAGGQAVILDVSPRPVRAMRELTFSVETPGTGASREAPRIDLAMPGMRMPPNRVDLRRGADGIYRGKGTIVRCGSGRRTWTATVTFADGTRAVFTFDVAD